uniref:Uncharacterized protein n=1 Tax=Romanomermis culicivorax TaxID=13658 RepID=A0A915KQV1_ROMCU
EPAPEEKHLQSIKDSLKVDALAAFSSLWGVVCRQRYSFKRMGMCKTLQEDDKIYQVVMRSNQ